MPEGWVLDAFPDPSARGHMVLWLATPQGAVRFSEPFAPVLYARGHDVASLRRLADVLSVLDGLGPLEVEEAVCGLDEGPSPVLRVPVLEPPRVGKVAEMIDAQGAYRDFEVFDADLRMAHRFLLAKGLWPLAKVRAWRAGHYRRLEESKWDVNYEMPALRSLGVGAAPDTPAGTLPSLDARLARAWTKTADGMETRFEGTERQVLEALQAAVDAADPDIIVTRGGDTFLLPWLRAVAERLDVPFRLGREADPQRPRRQGKSYFTYGKIKYQAPSYALHGRVHLDADSSFFYTEGGMHGLVDLARVSRVPLQDVARLGAGTALTAIQIDLAKEQGRLVPWKKNVPEAWKTAKDLLLADRGGYIFEPSVGLHEDVVELDFAAMYPNIMVRHNISPESILCSCCSLHTGEPVPQLGTWTCRKRKAFIPTYLEPVVARREYFKKMRKTDPANRRAYQEICDSYKWLLVCSFGYQGYRNAKFGRIECHEAISAWGRETLLSAAEIAHDHGFAFVHGIVDSLWLQRIVPGADAEALSAAVGRELGIPFEYQGRYKWIVFLPNRSHPARDGVPAVGALNRYYGCFDEAPDKPSRSQAGQPLDYIAGGALKVRGVELRQHSTPRILREVQETFLQEVAEADDASEFRARLPRAIEAVRPVVDRILDGEAVLRDLVFTTTVSQTVEDYRSLTAPAAALRQLANRGVRIPPGDVIAYVVLDKKSRDPERKVVEARLLTGTEEYDREAYARVALRALASLTLPFGWSEDVLAERWRVGKQARLPVRA